MISSNIQSFDDSGLQNSVNISGSPCSLSSIAVSRPKMMRPSPGNRSHLAWHLYLSCSRSFLSIHTHSHSHRHTQHTQRLDRSPPWQLVHSQLWITGRTTGSLSPLSHCRLRKRTGVSGSRR